MICEACKADTINNKYYPCQTSYADESQNKDPFLCPECWLSYKEYWDDMWTTYHEITGV